MKAGRELDALIAEKVLGLSGVRDGKSWLYGDNWTHNKEGVLCLVPHYSTQIADAWLVVEKLHNDSVGIIRVSNGDGDSYDCDILPYLPKEMDGCSHAHITAESWPLAICLAALKAVE